MDYLFIIIHPDIEIKWLLLSDKQMHKVIFLKTEQYILRDVWIRNSRTVKKFCVCFLALS